MKKLCIVAVSLSILVTGCMETRYITERYIKTNIEEHYENEFSTLKTYTIFKGTSYGGGSYLELTGYKYNNTKELVIGADKYYLARQKFQGDQTVIAEIVYIELSLNQCKAIIDNYKILQSKIKVEKPIMSEEIYHDYTVSNDLFISYRKSTGSYSTSYIDFWIKGEKYSVSTTIIMDKLIKFINY